MKVDKNLIIPSLSGLQYGYNTAVIAGALLYLTKTFSLTALQEGFLVAMAMVGLCIAAFAGILSNVIGRKPSLLLSSGFFLIGELLCVWAPTFPILLVGRFLVGAGCGIAVVVSPIYLIEMAPAETRGAILNLNQIGIALGSLFAYICNYLFEDWRMMFGVAILPALIQGAGLFFVPESIDKAKRSEASWKRVIDPSYLPRFKVVLALSFFQALCGSAAVFFFAPSVFESVGFADPKSSLLATILIGLVYLCAILVSFWVIDRLGRRFLLFTSLWGMALTLFTIFLFPTPLVTLICLLFYIAFYSLGMGPVPPLVIGEISPVQVRGHVMSLMGMIGWSVNYFITLTFLPLVGYLTVGGTFLIYAGFCLIGFGFFYGSIPETKKKSLDEIDRLFKKSR
ncbi:MAG: MFS transporter [Chlamydiae bacterium]|nr:MFS transporter [Chlamydiota bacterium]